MTVCFLNSRNTKKIEKIIGKEIIGRAFVRGGWGHYVFAYAKNEYNHYYRIDRKNKSYQICQVKEVDGCKIFLGFDPLSYKSRFLRK